MQIWLPAKLANKSDQAPNTDVGQTMLPSFARPLRNRMVEELRELYCAKQLKCEVVLDGKMADTTPENGFSTSFRNRSLD